MNISYFRYGLFFFSLVIPFASFAQDSQVSFKSYERLLLENPWANSDNTSGNIFNSYCPDGMFAINTDFKQGDLKLAQLPTEEVESGFIAQKMIRFDDIVFDGGFSYKNQQQQNVGWTARMDPLTNNPYMLADSSYGLYNKDYINLFGSFGYQINQKVSAGIKVDYLVGDGARIKDPRPVNDKYSLDFYPSVIYRFPNLSMGANLHLMMGREKIAYSTINSNINHTFFFLYGLGKGAIPASGSSSYLRNYYSSGVGGDFQLNFLIGDINVFSGLGFFRSKENAEDGSQHPTRENGGDYIESEYNFYTIFKTKTNYIKTIKVFANLKLGEGIQIIERSELNEDLVMIPVFISQTSKYSLFKLNPGFTFTLAKPYNDYLNKWQLESGIEMNHFQDDYLLEAKQSITNIFPFTNFNYSVFKKNTLWKFGINGKYSLNLNKELTQIRPYTDKEIAAFESITYPDHLLLSSNTLSLGANIRYGREVKIIKDKTSQVFVDLSSMFMTASNEAWIPDKSMQFYSLKIGITY